MLKPLQELLVIPDDASEPYVMEGQVINHSIPRYLKINQLRVI